MNSPDKEYGVYKTVASDSAQNVLYAFIGVGLIWFFENIWLGFAKVLFWGGVALMLLDILHFLLSQYGKVKLPTE